MSAFRGFPVQAVRFLVELEANNEREWFKSNRARYEEHLVTPAMALADDLADLGPAHLFRPWNNTRFRPGPPLKEHLGLAIGYGGAGGFYVELSLDGLLVAAGLHRPSPDQVERLRRALAAKRSAFELTHAIARARAAGLALNDPELDQTTVAVEHAKLEILVEHDGGTAERSLDTHAGPAVELVGELID